MKKFYGFTVLILVIAFGLGTLTGYYARGKQIPTKQMKVESPAFSYEFYLAENNGMVTVYRVENNEIYEYTNIRVEDLPRKVQEEIKERKYMENESELYAFLESYTS